ncbi:SH3 domain-containing protein [Seohaeicola saemankumensis]|nr:SH3 domain-containing protein [Seohaeicola saemankumensis]MCA0873984.1 SH3 domain-containing protein [Seohaeicola saemankumensis]
MKSVIVISFVFMALAFYELSGGADFEPRGVRPPKPERTAATAPGPTAPRAKPALGGTVQATTLVAKPVLTPRKPAPDQTPDPAPEQTAALSPEEEERLNKARLDQVRSSLGPSLSLFPAAGDTGSITLASLEGGAQGLRVTATETDEAAEAPADPAIEEPAPDIREVTGTRVNMRDGPGTIYPVISRLTIGQEVEVLSESGTGWLRLRTVQGRQIGWIAASLISKRAR